MKTQFIIWIKDIKKGRNENWLHFNAYVDCFDKNRLYGIDFCGTMIESSIPLTDYQRRLFADLLSNDFGFAPYDVEKATKVIGDGKGYVIDRKAMTEG